MDIGRVRIEIIVIEQGNGLSISVLDIHWFLNFKMGDKILDFFKPTISDKIFGLLVPMIIIIVNSIEIHLLRKTRNKNSMRKCC